MKYLRIVISGGPETGKSTVANMLAAVFKQAGNNVTLNVSDDGSPPMTEERVQAGVERILAEGNLEVHIVTRRRGVPHGRMNPAHHNKSGLA